MILMLIDEVFFFIIESVLVLEFVGEEVVVMKVILFGILSNFFFINFKIEIKNMKYVLYFYRSIYIYNYNIF